MAGLSKITVNVGKNGIGRRTTTNDKISGIVFFDNTPPTAFATNNINKVFSLPEAEALGITASASGREIQHYDISEYFRLNPEGELYIGFFAVPSGAYDFSEVEAIQNFANGEIRQLAVHAYDLNYADSQTTTLQGRAETLNLAGRPISILYAADFSGITAVTGWNTIADLRTKSDDRVSVVISQDGGKAGKALFDSQSKSITTIGAHLGAVSRASVAQTAANPENFNFSNGIELEVIALANGDLISAISETALGGLKDKGYTVMRKYLPDISGSFSERIPSATASSSDLAWLDAVRTIDKAQRLLRSVYTPKLNSLVELNSDGTLTDDVIGFFQDLGQSKLEVDMISRGELSDAEIVIDPSQNILSTSNFVITARLLPLGVAEFIEINIGFVQSL